MMIFPRVLLPLRRTRVPSARSNASIARPHVRVLDGPLLSSLQGNDVSVSRKSL